MVRQGSVKVKYIICIGEFDIEIFFMVEPQVGYSKSILKVKIFSIYKEVLVKVSNIPPIKRHENSNHEMKIKYD